MATYFPTSNGRIKIQAETLLGTNPTGWVYQAPGTGNNPNAQGGYYYFRSETLDGSVKTPNVGVFTATIEVAEAGLYDIRVRSARDTNDPGDSRNDMWLKVDDDIRDVLPEGTVPITVTNGFVKLKGATTSWAYARLFSAAEEDDANPPSKVYLSEGLHTITFAGRSVGFHIDFFEVIRDGLQVPPTATNTPMRETDDPAPLTVALVDTDTDRIVAMLDDGDAFGPATAARPLTLAVEVTDGGALDGEVGSVTMRLTGAGSVTRTESGDSSFSLFGDADGDYRNGVQPGSGSYSFTVDAYSGAGGRGRLIDSFDFDFTVVAPPAPPKPALTVALVDTDTDRIVAMLDDGDAFGPKTAARPLTLAVEVTDGGALDGEVGSVTMRLTGAGSVTRTESGDSSFSLFGDADGDYRNGVKPGSGSYSFTVEAYSGAGGRGALVDSFDYDFTVTDGLLLV